MAESSKDMKDAVPPPSASPRLSPHPVLDAPKVDMGDDAPSFSVSLISSYVLTKIFKLYSARKNATVAPSTVGAGVFSVLFLLPKVLAYYRTRQRRAVLRELAKEKVVKVKERNARVVTILKLDGLRPPKESDIIHMSATTLLAKMRSKELTCREIITAFCARAAGIQEILNCGTEFCFIEALQAADMVDAWRNDSKNKGVEEPPMLGLPVSIKDLFHQEGYDTTCGCPAFLFSPAEKDGKYLQIIHEQGAIPFIRSNVPQAMMVPETDNNVFGRSFNPHNFGRTVGGSSGGEGGLIAAHASPLGIGTDIGGSIRIPAHFCGICGLKPTSTRLTKLGMRAPRYNGQNGQLAIRSTSGPMARSVDDIVLYTRAMLEPRKGRMMWSHDPYRPPVPWRKDILTGKRRLRIGYFASSPYFPSSPACNRAVHEAVDHLYALGHECIDIYDAVPSSAEGFGLYAGLLSSDGQLRSMREGLYGEQFVENYKMIYMYSLIPNLLRAPISAVLKYVLGEPRKAMLNRCLGARSTYEYWGLVAKMKSYQEKWVHMAKALELDVIVSPGSSLPALTHGGFRKLQASFHYNTMWNLLDWPCGVVPVTQVREDEDGVYVGTPANDSLDKAAMEETQGSKGMPVGVQVASLPYNDEMVLRVMKEIEERAKFNSSPAV
jgi:fatty acid amide hydrolase